MVLQGPRNPNFLGFPAVFDRPVIDSCPTKSSFVNFGGVTSPTPPRSYDPDCKRRECLEIKTETGMLLEKKRETAVEIN